jgi:hemerythrin
VLFKIMERLKAALVDREQHLLDGLMLSVEAYFDAHLESEEELMRVWEYPHAEAHVREHTQFRSQIHVLAGAVRAGHTELAATTLDMLNEWLCQHVTGTDRPLALYLNSVGAGRKRLSARTKVLEQPQPAA